MSEYIKPHLIEGFKYDLWLYVLVTSYDPLWIYIYEEGLVRFATEKYTEDMSNEFLNNKFIHLTNYSINKDSDNFVECEEVKPNGWGSKWCLKSLWRKFI